ncbi:MAG: 3'-5' exonuclease [Thiotrichaceae bacterium]|nr:3'-5' exonuclease [Thiotrichaceae bacterium]
MPPETFNRLLADIQTHLKRRKGLSDPHLKALHNRCEQLDIKAINMQLVTNTRFVVIDTETTGLHAYSGDEIISICLLEMQGLTLTGRKFQTLINPQRHISELSTAIHGLRDEDIVGCPKITDILAELIEFLGEAVIIGHHLGFDLRFLNKTFKKELLCKLHHPWLDTMLLYIAYSGRLGHYSLDEVAKNCRIKNHARHTALGDAMITAQIFQKIAAKMLLPNSKVAELVKNQFQVG